MPATNVDTLADGSQGWELTRVWAIAGGAMMASYEFLNISHVEEITDPPIMIARPNFDIFIVLDDDIGDRRITTADGSFLPDTIVRRVSINKEKDFF